MPLAQVGTSARRVIRRTMTSMEHDELEQIRTRLCARFADGWPAYVGVPDTWLPHLGALDTQLAALDPAYQVAQIKTKWGGLRFYLDGPLQPPCCQEWEVANPVPADDAGDTAWEEYEHLATAHTYSPEHQTQDAARNARLAAMDELISAAETASYTW